jgi:demethylmenaquinone methyltransferase/2-methoxy-6-polyprenyl-1,4-benzoquinol methylase
MSESSSWTPRASRRRPTRPPGRTTAARPEFGDSDPGRTRDAPLASRLPGVPEAGAPASGPDPERAVAQYRLEGPAYDWTTAPYVSLRRQVVELLDPGRGAAVIDVGCGTGLAFPFLEAEVGPEGHIIGVDQSPEMLAQARSKIERHGWRNISLVEAAAHEAVLPDRADAALFCATHDILRSPTVLAHLLGHVRPGGRVAAAGGKWAPPWMLPLNMLVFWQHYPFVTTFEGFERPWTHLERFLRDVEVREVVFGTGYLVTGVKKA